MNIEADVSDKGMIEEKETDEETNTLPSSHVSIHKTQLAILKHKAELHDKLMKQISTNQYVGTDVRNNMIGFGASILPKAGYEGIAESLPFFIGSFLSNCGISYNPERLVNSLPSNKTIERAVEDNAVSNILLTQDAIRKNLFVYICADKGNKKGNKNLSKFICWYDQSEKKVRTFLIDCDCTNESTIDVAAALNHSLRRVFPSDVSTTVYGQCTDSGGGGTKYALQKALKDLEIASDEYLVSTCSLHNLQTMLRNAVVTVLGEGGQDENGNYVMNTPEIPIHSSACTVLFLRGGSTGAPSSRIHMPIRHPPLVWSYQESRTPVGF